MSRAQTNYYTKLLHTYFFKISTSMFAKAMLQVLQAFTFALVRHSRLSLREPLNRNRYQRMLNISIRRLLPTFNCCHTKITVSIIDLLVPATQYLQQTSFFQIILCYSGLNSPEQHVCCTEVLIVCCPKLVCSFEPFGQILSRVH